jgi:hypothetical protein
LAELAPDPPERVIGLVDERRWLAETRKVIKLAAFDGGAKLVLGDEAHRAFRTERERIRHAVETFLVRLKNARAGVEASVAQTSDIIRGFVPAAKVSIGRADL